MRAVKLAVWILLLALPSLGFGADNEAGPSAKSSSRDVKVPRALVGEIEKEYKDFLKKNEVADKQSIDRGLLNVAIDFTQDHKAALQDDAHIVTPTGGGVIDLADVVTPLKGAFRVKMEIAHAGEKSAATSKVFFVSHARSRKLAGEIYGDGCNKYMDITSAYNDKWLKRGFELYTADQRYVSVLGGTFLFVDFTKEQLYVASVTFTDSRYPDLLCE